MRDRDFGQRDQPPPEKAPLTKRKHPGLTDYFYIDYRLTARLQKQSARWV
jgi:hypothetical protein